MKRSKKSVRDPMAIAKMWNAEYPCNWATRTIISFGGVNIEDQIEMNRGILQRYVVTATDPSIQAETLRLISISNLLPLAERRLSIGTIVEFNVFTQTSSEQEDLEEILTEKASVDLKK